MQNYSIVFRKAVAENEVSSLVRNELLPLIHANGVRYVYLTGPLGAGKTTLCKDLISLYAGCSRDDVSSPTYSYCSLYKAGKDSVIHIDAYRISSADECYELGLVDDVKESVLAVVEWPDVIESVLSQNPEGASLRLSLSYDLSDHSVRIIEASLSLPSGV